MNNLFIIFVLAIASQSLADSVTDGTKLIGAIFMHRHGDRTPASETSAAFSTDPDAVIAASAPYGYGQLTEVGKRRAYKLGQTIRERYDELLSSQYNKSEIYIRSTDYTRTKMTVLIAMAAVYPSYPGSWSDDINWVPTPYTTTSAKYDFNLFSSNCPNYGRFENADMTSTSRMDKYFDVLNIVSEASSFNITEVPVMAYTIYDTYVCQQSLGIPLGDELDAILPQLKEAAGVAGDIILGNENYIRLQAGVMLNEFFTQADNLISGTDTPPVRIYSAHDLNVYSFQSVAKISERQGYPEYASAFSLELRQIKETGQYVVLPVYYATPGAGPTYVSVAGCDSLLCDYDTYKELVSEYTLDEKTWRTECGWTEDLEVSDPQ